MLLLDQRPTRAETPPDAAGAVERVQQAMSNIEVRGPHVWPELATIMDGC